MTESIVADSTEKKSKNRIVDFTLKLSPLLYLNQLDEETKKIAAPSPVVFAPGIGLIIPNNTLFAFEPTISIFSSYFQWANGMAVPAEIENRTATTLSLVVDLPLVVSLFLKKSKLQISAGPAMLMRFGFLSRGVGENDYGASGTASGDVELINSFFWSGFRFLYISTNISWMYNFYRKTKAGPFIAAYFPIGSLAISEGINGLMASIGLKVSF